MAKKIYTPNVNENYREIISYLEQALHRIENGVDSAPLCMVNTYVGLARQRAMTVHYYAKDMLNDDRFQALESLEKLALDYEIAHFERLMPSPAGHVHAKIAAGIDENATRQALLAGIRNWLQ